ncbi:unnamed protein product [Brachionus calyciflorus]|uniref:Homeobox domain-containing protein n=1 Tax=Brachionus calyciflorus TaxID=104777 RepID=A0A813VPP5_9BILA|nr:unnamed protein product [Brachionus calyciflorus]
MSNQSFELLILNKAQPPVRQRRQRTNFDQSVVSELEKLFLKNPYPDINEREQMARDLKTSEDRVQVWFQNKRARYRQRVKKESILYNSKNLSKNYEFNSVSSSNSDSNESFQPIYCQSPASQSNISFNSILNYSFSPISCPYIYQSSPQINTSVDSAKNNNKTFKIFRPFE